MAATGNVTIVMKAADAELLRAWERARQGPAQYEQELRRVKGQGAQLKQSTDGMFRSFTGGFGAAAASAVGFSTGVGPPSPRWAHCGTNTTC